MDAFAQIIGIITGGIFGLAIVYLFFLGFRKLFPGKKLQKQGSNIIEPKENIINNRSVYSIDLSTVERKSKIVIHMVPRPQQRFITQYGIRIDDSDLIKISNNCDVILTLNSGTRELEICALPTKIKEIYGSVFGKPSKLQVFCGAETSIEYEYVGPSWMWMAGKIKKK